MSLAAGVRLGPYEITGWIAAGGMGDVYRARDTRLGRNVAVKVLPDHALNTPARRARFEREARAISHLTHPSICTLYDVGEHDGVPFVVMELLEGETLSERLLRGPLPLAEAARAGAELASALDHAHRHGIVHRDLKPTNIMVTAAGVRLLDFGIANFEPYAEAADSFTGHAAATESLTNPGQILGTLKYMAPEQLEGSRVDGRTDIFALGMVLYEMAVGRPPFDAASQAATIAAILSTDAAAVSVARKRAGADEPAAVLLDEVVARCLAKDPEERWQSARDLCQALQWVEANARGGEPFRHSKPQRWWKQQTGGIALGMSLLTALLIVFAITNREITPAARPSRWLMTAPEGSTFDPSGYSMALSPDGTQLAFIASSAAGDNGLWVRPLDSLVPRKLADGAAQPFWSADSRSIGFDGGGQFKRVDLATGLVQPLGQAFVQSGSWNHAGTLLLAMPLAERRYTPHGLHSVSASGGPLKRVTTLDSSRAEFNHLFPQFLPDGRRFLFLARSKDPEQDGMLYAGSLDSFERVALFQSLSRVVYASGYLVFARDGTLLAQKFDPSRLRLDGHPVIVAEDIERTTNRPLGAAFSVSDNGVLAYRSDRQSALAWFDRSGRSLGAIAEPAHYSNPDLSADEQRVAVSRRDPVTGQSNVWVIDLNRRLQSKLTFGETVQGMPLWSPDGRRVVYRAGTSLVVKESSGAGRDTVLADQLTNFDNPLDWSLDGQMVLFSSFDSTDKTDLWLLSADGGRPRTAVPGTGSRWGVQARISPDGRWLAYASNESGRYEVYVRPFPSGDGKWLITSGGGSEPSWRRDGKELYYIAPDGALTAVSVATAPTFEAGARTRLFKTEMSTLVNTSFTRNQYVASADGQRFLLNQPIGPQASIVVMMDWLASLPKRD
jgi:serine/threonine protein kinase/Tol biopolymer transport system component